MYSCVSRMVFRRSLSALLAVLLAVLLVSCSPAPFRANAKAVSQIVIDDLSDPKTFNILLSQESTILPSMLYEGFVTENGVDATIEPGIAESWTISEDKLRYVFTLREGLKWSDGTPLTTADVDFTYNQLVFNEEIPTDYRDVLRIGDQGVLPKVKVLDDRRVEFILPEPFAPFLRTIGTILPKHVLEPTIKQKDKQGKPLFLSTWATDTNPRKIIGNGPYRLVQYDTSQRLIYERNPYYWRNKDPNQPQPSIERVVSRIVESTDTSLLQFRSGGLDMVAASAQDFALLKREEKRGNFKIYNAGQSTSTSFISFNLNQAKNAKGQPLVDPIKSRWFNTLAFRQAIAYAINRDQMINNVFRGLGQPQNSPITVQSPYYLKPEEGLKVYDYNPEKAKSLLLGAGFKYDNQGQLLDRDGNRVRFTLITNSEAKTRVTMAAQIKQDLSKIGIQVDLNPISFNTLVGKLSDTRDWECYLLGFSGGVEPNNGANVWRSKGGLHTFNQGPQPGQPPLIGWTVSDWEKEIDRLYIQGARELDDAKRKAIYAKTQQITQEQLPMIYLVNPLVQRAIRNRIQGVEFTTLAGVMGPLWNIYQLTLSD